MWFLDIGQTQVTANILYLQSETGKMQEAVKMVVVKYHLSKKTAGWSLFLFIPGV
jgi:hypothetical protein